MEKKRGEKTEKIMDKTNNNSRYWFSEFIDNPEANAKFIEVITVDGTGIMPNFDVAISLSPIRNRSEYIAHIRQSTIAHAKNHLALSKDPDEYELINLVRLLTNLDEFTGEITGRMADYRRLVGETNNAVIEIEDVINRIKKTRKNIADEIGRVASVVLPNSSALAGPIVAGRMLERAGSLLKLSNLPASSLQVLGAESALFSHLTRQSPSPKHGIIYQHKRVHVSNKKRRGRVSRVFACKFAIAAKIDYYRKEIDDSFLSGADLKIHDAGEKL